MIIKLRKDNIEEYAPTNVDGQRKALFAKGVLGHTKSGKLTYKMGKKELAKSKSKKKKK